MSPESYVEPRITAGGDAGKRSSRAVVASSGNLVPRRKVEIPGLEGRCLKTVAGGKRRRGCEKTPFVPTTNGGGENKRST